MTFRAIDGTPTMARDAHIRAEARDSEVRRPPRNTVATMLPRPGEIRGDSQGRQRTTRSRQPNDAKGLVAGSLTRSPCYNVAVREFDPRSPLFNFNRGTSSPEPPYTLSRGGPLAPLRSRGSLAVARSLPSGGPSSPEALVHESCGREAERARFVRPSGAAATLKG